MIRTVWLAIACLIALAGLTVLKLGGAPHVQEAPAPSVQGAANLASDPPLADVLPKGDRLDVAADDDPIKPVRPVAITTRFAAAVPSEATAAEEQGWRRSYAKREAAAGKHRKSRLHKASRRHRSMQASRSHGKSRYAMVRKQKKSRARS